MFMKSQADIDKDLINQHYGAVAYYNARKFEEAVNNAPANVDKDALREALRPMVDEWNKRGGYLPDYQIERMVKAITTYAGKKN